MKHTRIVRRREIGVHKSKTKLTLKEKELLNAHSKRLNQQNIALKANAEKNRKLIADLRKQQAALLKSLAGIMDYSQHLSYHLIPHEDRYRGLKHNPVEGIGSICRQLHKALEEQLSLGVEQEVIQNLVYYVGSRPTFGALLAEDWMHDAMRAVHSQTQTGRWPSTPRHQNLGGPSNRGAHHPGEEPWRRARRGGRGQR